MNGIIITKFTTEYNPELMSVKQDYCDTDMIYDLKIQHREKDVFQYL